MPEVVKRALEKIIETYGASLCSEPNRLKGLLYDISPSKRKEITALLLVVQEGLIPELKKYSNRGVRLHSILNRLHNTTGIDKALAEWSIGVWIEALGLVPPPKRRRVRFGWRSANRKIAGSKPVAQITPAKNPVGQGQVAAGAVQAVSTGHTPPTSQPSPSTPPKKQGQATPPAGGTGVGLSVGRQWIWIPALAALSLFVIIAYSVMRDTGTPVIPDSPPVATNVPPKENTDKYSIEDIRSTTNSALENSKALSKNMYKLTTTKTAIENAKELARLSPSYQSQLTLLEDNISSLNAAIDAHFGEYIENITLLGECNSAIVDSVLQSPQRSVLLNDENLALSLLRQHLEHYRINHRIEHAKWRHDFEEVYKQVAG